MPTPTSKQLISGLYVAAYYRAPTQDGLDFWQAAFNGNPDHDLASMKQIAAGFVTHPAFTQLYGPYPNTHEGNQQFVAAIYQNVLGGPGTPAGITFWADALDAGQSRSDMLASFVLSALTAEFPNQI